jgi:hypothetical protein
MSQQWGVDLRGVVGDPGVARAPDRKVKKKRGQRKEAGGTALPGEPCLESGGGPGEKEDDMRAWVQGRKVLAVLTVGNGEFNSLQSAHRLSFGETSHVCISRICLRHESASFARGT